MIGEAYKWSCEQLLELLKVDCISASITTDFWTSRARHGYIGVTCSWISQDWTLHESLLALRRVKYPHIGEIIKLLLDDILGEWKITKKSLTLTTDNGSNIKKAGRLMADSILHLPCAAHTLQLTVGKGLNLVKELVLRAKRLVDFFNVSPKQRERLQTAQEFLGYSSIKHVIGDVSTRWNSTYYAWERLIELKRAIKFLPGQLKSDLDKDAQKDGEKLEKIMLSDEEWSLIENLLDLLSGFEEVTRLLSGAKYCTISLMYPAISAIIATIKPKSNQDNASLDFELDFDDVVNDVPNDEEITILDNIEVTIADHEDEVEIEVIDLTSCTGRSRKKVNISGSMQTRNTISDIQNILYNSMFNYWKNTFKVGMIACLLDPRFKKLQFVRQETRNLIIQDLKFLYEDAQIEYNLNNIFGLVFKAYVYIVFNKYFI